MNPGSSLVSQHSHHGKHVVHLETLSQGRKAKSNGGKHLTPFSGLCMFTNGHECYTLTCIHHTHIHPMHTDTCTLTHMYRQCPLDSKFFESLPMCSEISISFVLSCCFQKLANGILFTIRSSCYFSCYNPSFTYP